MARTPIGAFNGSLTGMTATEMGSLVLKTALDRAGLKGEQVGEVFLGNVLMANNGQAPAKIAALNAGLPTTVPCTAVNKVCASGMKAVILGAQSIMLGDNDVVIAGGMESMTNAPYYIPKGRSGYRYGNGELLDAIVRDGLQDPYDHCMMGNVAEICAKEYNFSREDQDAYAIESYKRAAAAYERGAFDEELVQVSIPQRRGDDLLVADDDEYKKINYDKVATVRPAFEKEGTVTAINASKINDGAAALVMVSGEKLKELGLTPLAKVRSYADASQEPKWFTTTPSKAMPKAMDKAGVKTDEVDVWEINEAFSVVALANMKEMGIPHDKVNVLGGAVSLGHPIGASGARITCTLISALKDKNGKIGVAGICNGGGGASALVLERV